MTKPFKVAKVNKNVEDRIWRVVVKNEEGQCAAHDKHSDTKEIHWADLESPFVLTFDCVNDAVKFAAKDVRVPYTLEVVDVSMLEYKVAWKVSM